MKQMLIGATLLVAGIVGVAGAAPVSAQTPNPGVCQPQDQHLAPTGADKTTVTATAPAGKQISGYCVKSGSINQDLGPEYVTLPQPAKTVTFTYTKTTDVKDISHYVLFYVVEATPAVPTSTPPSCDAPGTVVVPASTAAYTYDSSEAGGVMTVTVKANAGYVLVANMGPWTFPIAQLTGEVCVASNPPPATPATPATPAAPAPTVGSTGGTVTAATPVVGAAGPVPAQAAPTQALPATGTSSWVLAFIAMALVLVGSGFVSFSRRFS